MSDSGKLVADLIVWSLVCIPTLATSIPLSMAATYLFKRKAHWLVIGLAWVPTVPLMKFFLNKYVDGNVAFLLLMPVFWPIALSFALLPAAAISLATSVPITLVLSRRLREDELPKALVVAPRQRERLDQASDFDLSSPDVQAMLRSTRALIATTGPVLALLPLLVLQVPWLNYFSVAVSVVAVVSLMKVWRSENLSEGDIGKRLLLAFVPIANVWVIWRAYQSASKMLQGRN